MGCPTVTHVIFDKLGLNSSGRWHHRHHGHWVSRNVALSGHSRSLIKILLETGERFVDLFRLTAKVGDGIRDGVVVFEQEQRRELFLVEFLDTDGNVMLEDEIEEALLLGVETGRDVNLRIRSSDFSGDSRQGVGNMGQHIEEVALLGVDDFLHLGELVVAEAFFGKSLQQFSARVGGAPDGTEFGFVLEELGKFAEKHLHELLCGYGRAVRVPEGGHHHVLDVALLAVGQLHLDLLFAYTGTFPAD